MRAGRHPVELHVSQRNLGNMAGGSRESVNKIAELASPGVDRSQQKGSIMIRNVEAVERLI